MVLTCSKEHVLFDIVKITAGHDGCHRLPADALCRPDIDRATRFSAWREVDTGATKTHHDQTTADCGASTILDQFKPNRRHIEQPITWCEERPSHTLMAMTGDLDRCSGDRAGKEQFDRA
jgi:hypothetical protein